MTGYKYSEFQILSKKTKITRRVWIGRLGIITRDSEYNGLGGQ